MLERTAACLESGTLWRLLPRNKHCPESRRRLHSSFWNHGGGAIELSPLWVALVRGLEHQGFDEEHKELSSNTTTHERTVLDFLYPTGTTKFFRRYTSPTRCQQERRRYRSGFRRLGQRQYTSAANDQPLSDQDFKEENRSAHFAFDRFQPLSSHTSTGKTIEKNALAEPPLWGLKERKDISYATTVAERPAGRYETQLRKNQRYRSPDWIRMESIATEKAAFLARSLGVNGDHEYDKVWLNYTLPDQGTQRQLYPQIIEYLSTSSRQTDMAHLMEIFSQMDNLYKDEKMFTIAIRASLRQQDLKASMQLLDVALDILEAPVGSSEILAFLVDNSLWEDVFSLYSKIRIHLMALPTATYDLFEVLKSLPELTNRVFGLVEYMEKESTLSSSQRLKELSIEVISTTLLSTTKLWPSLFSTFLRKLQNLGGDTPLFYQKLIIHLIRIKRSRLATRCYCNARVRDEIKLPKKVLSTILSLLCAEQDISNIKQLLKDFYRLHDKPNRSSYRMAMNVFASQGDAITVHALFNECFGEMIQAPMASKSPIRSNDFAPLLHVHARRGELKQVIAIFNDIESKYGVQQSVLCWNILINAYGKVHDFDGAISTFEKLMQSKCMKPNDYTFGTIMGICASRGDLEQAIGIYKLAKKMLIPESTSIIEPLVLLHAQNGSLYKAESICETSLHIGLTGSLTLMWNHLLFAFANRCDLDSVDRLLKRMSTNGIAHDSYTYAALLQALAVAKQPNQAYRILKDDMPRAGILPKNLHYSIVMGGYIANGEYHKVSWVRNRMKRRNIRESASTKLMTLRASVRQDEQHNETMQGAIEASGAIKYFREAISSMDAQDISGPSRKGISGLPLDIAYPSTFYSYMIFVLGQQHNFEAVRDLYDEFMKLLPKTKHPPIKVLTALMVSKFCERDYDAVKELWKMVLAQGKEQGFPLVRFRPIIEGVNSRTASRRPEDRKILPSHQLDLSVALSTYINTLMHSNSLHILPSVINGLLADGFKLDNKNWNHYIFALIQMHRWKQAFDLCETKLMEGWSGDVADSPPGAQQHKVSNLKVRALRNDPTLLRPKHHTLLHLARVFLELRTMAIESTRSEFLVDYLERSCPRTLSAIKGMQRLNDELEHTVFKRW